VTNDERTDDEETDDEETDDEETDDEGTKGQTTGQRRKRIKKVRRRKHMVKVGQDIK
jgi:hypothetical protein